MSTVVIIEPRCELYRKVFYEGLTKLLASNGVKLSLIYGESNRYEMIRTGHVRGAIEVHNRYLYLGKRFLVWQPLRSVLRHLRGVDLVIIHQNSANLINYPALVLGRAGAFRVAMWGHGRCLQEGGDRRVVREAFKRWYSKQVDHWFAYTDLSRDIVEGFGYPPEKITVVNNSIDSRPLIEAYGRISSGEDHVLRTRLGIPEDARVGLYCGRFYRDKRLRFLMDAATQIRIRCRQFHLIVIGEGESEREITDYAKANPEWVHFVGPQYGLDRVPYFRVAACQLNPGLVGLGIVDSFAMLTPLITTDAPIHAPEIAYLKSGVNGLITPNSVETFASTATRYLLDERAQAELKRGCSEARAVYTLDNMVHRFANGVLSAIRTGQSITSDEPNPMGRGLEVNS